MGNCVLSEETESGSKSAGEDGRKTSSKTLAEFQVPVLAANSAARMGTGPLPQCFHSAAAVHCRQRNSHHGGRHLLQGGLLLIERLPDLLRRREDKYHSSTIAPCSSARTPPQRHGACPFGPSAHGPTTYHRPLSTASRCWPLVISEDQEFRYKLCSTVEPPSSNSILEKPSQ